MFKKLVVLTLAVLMLLIPMTAFAVSWSTVVTALHESGSYSGEGIDATVDDGDVAVTGDGTIEDFVLSEEFKSYTFGGTVAINNEIFYIRVSNSGTTRAVTVNVESGVVINTYRVDIGADGNAEVTFNNGGAININFSHSSIDEDGDNYSGEIFIGSSGSGRAILNNSGTIFIDGEFSMWTSDNSNVLVVNKNKITAEELFWPNAADDSEILIRNEKGAVIYFVEGDPGNDDYVRGVLELMTSENGRIGMVNNGVVDGDAYLIPFDNGTGSFENNGVVDGDLVVLAYDNTSANATNNSTVTGNLETIATGSSAEEDDPESIAAYSSYVEVVNSAGGVVEGSWYVAAEGGGTSHVSATNKGTVGDRLTAETYDFSTAEVINEGTVKDLIANSFDNSSMLLENNGEVEGNITAVAHDDSTLRFINHGTIEVTGLSIAMEERMLLDSSAELVAQAAPEDAVLNGELEWTTSDESVVCLNDGTAYAAGQGEAVLTVTAPNGISTSMQVTVYAPSLRITSYPAYLAAGAEEAIVVEATGDILPAYEFAVEDSTILSVSQEGMLTGLKPGTTTVYVLTEQGIQASCSVTVVEATLSCRSLTLTPGQSVRIDVLPDILGAADHCTWTSDEDSVASVADNVITANGVGTTVLRCGLDENAMTVSLTVTESLATMTLPGDLKHLADEALCENGAVERIVLGDSLTSVESGAMAQMTSLKQVILSAGIQSIADDAFEGDGMLTLLCAEGSFGHLYARAHGLPYAVLK